jgi:hypothetical protein
MQVSRSLHRGYGDVHGQVRAGGRAALPGSVTVMRLVRRVAVTQVRFVLPRFSAADSAGQFRQQCTHRPSPPQNTITKNVYFTCKLLAGNILLLCPDYYQKSCISRVKARVTASWHDPYQTLTT